MNVTVGRFCLFSDFNIAQSINERLFVFFFSFLVIFCLLQIANETKTGNGMSKIFILQLFEMFDCVWNSSKVLFAQTNQVKWLHQLPIATIGRSFFSFFSKVEKKTPEVEKVFIFRGKKMSKNFAQKDIKWTEADSIEMVKLVIFLL